MCMKWLWTTHTHMYIVDVRIHLPLNRYRKLLKRTYFLLLLYKKENYKKKKTVFFFWHTFNSRFYLLLCQLSSLTVLRNKCQQNGWFHHSMNWKIKDDPVGVQAKSVLIFNLPPQLIGLKKILWGYFDLFGLHQDLNKLLSALQTSPQTTKSRQTMYFLKFRFVWHALPGISIQLIWVVSQNTFTRVGPLYVSLHSHTLLVEWPINSICVPIPFKTKKQFSFKGNWKQSQIVNRKILVFVSFLTPSFTTHLTLSYGRVKAKKKGKAKQSSPGA